MTFAHDLVRVGPADPPPLVADESGGGRVVEFRVPGPYATTDAWLRATSESVIDLEDAV